MLYEVITQGLDVVDDEFVVEKLHTVDIAYLLFGIDEKDIMYSPHKYGVVNISDNDKLTLKWLYRRITSYNVCYTKLLRCFSFYV